MKTRICFTLFIILGFILEIPVFAGSKPPVKGDMLSEFNLPFPGNPKYEKYLGIEGKDIFDISQIRAQVVIIQIFSMY
jgi:hypothetical protein